jgi:hypothetical protein
MNTVIFQTGNGDAIFEFDRKSVMDCLEHRKTLYEIKELDLLMDVIRSQPETATLSIEEHRYFGFIALDLINDGEGSALCKTCNKQYRSNQLNAFTVGPDETTFKVNTRKKGGFKSLFRKKPKPKPIGLSGGKGVKCPEGHELIFMISWIT